MEPVTMGILATIGVVGYELWSKGSATNGKAPLSNVTPKPIPPKPGTTPAPSPVTPVGQLPTDAPTLAMIVIGQLQVHGYKACDQPYYRAFQTAAHLTADGFPGTHTMTAIDSVIQQNAGSQVVPGAAVGPTGSILAIPVYPWLASGGYDGVNAPTEAEWNGSCS